VLLKGVRPNRDRHRDGARSRSALAACSSSSGGGSASGSKHHGERWTGRQPSPPRPGGGMDALVAAAKAEGTLNLIAVPRHVGGLRARLSTRSTAKYGIKINSENPDGSSGDEINAVKVDQGAKPALRTSSTSATRTRCPVPRRATSLRTRWRPGTTSRLR